MKRATVLSLTLGVTLTGLAAAAQIAPPSKFRLTPRYSRNLVSKRSVPLQTHEPHLPPTASPDIVWVQCPPEAQSLGATCGRLPVPLDRHHPDGKKIRVYFELYFHTNSGAEESAILANIGGPGVTTTGLRSYWLPMFAPNMDVHDVLLIDDRGRGMSEAIDCKELQHGTGPSFDQEIADCAAQLGAAASFYSTGDIAVDTDAVRAALGYDKVDYYGGSAGGVDVTSYATRFGSHLRSLILDSPWGTPGLVLFAGPYYNSLASPRSVRLDCLRSPTCAIDHRNPDAEFEQLIQTVRSQPVQGYAHDANGNLVPVDFDEIALAFLIPNPTGNFVSNGELLAANESLSQGDAAPLLRLGAEGVFPLVGDSGNPTSFSYGAAAATACVTIEVPYEWSVPPQLRLTQFADAVSDLPPDYFKPFSRAAAATAQLNDNVRQCLYWEEPTPPAPVVPPGGTYPAVPTLVLSSDIDTIIPDEDARKVAALFPDSTFLIVKEASHEPTGSSHCALSIVNNLIETLQVGDTTCLKTPETVWPALGRFPLVAADARPAEVDPDGNNQIGAPERKVVTVAVATAIDALKRSTIGSGNGVGLRAGKFPMEDKQPLSRTASLPTT